MGQISRVLWNKIEKIWVDFIFYGITLEKNQDQEKFKGERRSKSRLGREESAHT